MEKRIFWKNFKELEFECSVQIVETVQFGIVKQLIFNYFGRTQIVRTLPTENGEKWS